MSFSLKVSEFSEWTILHLDGLFNAFNERQLLEALTPYRRLHKVGLDLSATESMNLRILQEIFRWSEEARKTGGDFVLIAPTDSVRRSVEIFLGLHRLQHVRSLAELSLRDFYRRPAGLYEGPAPL
jgi:anti-anti-sigma regulatory factor